MLGKVQFLAAMLCVSSYTFAASPSIGSVTSRGGLKIDNHLVQGSGTVFDGSVIETGPGAQSNADLRLGSDAAIRLYLGSLGTLHRDRFELQRGTVELGSTSSYRIEANGLTIAPHQAHSSGQVSIEPGNSVSVVAQTGDLEITDGAGITIAMVHPGHPLSFSSLDAKHSKDFTATGVVSSQNGRYYLKTSETDVRYELKGDNLQQYDGSSVTASGSLLSALGEAGLLMAKTIDSSSGYTLPGQSLQSKTEIGGFFIGRPRAAVTVTGQGGGTCDSSQLVACCDPEDFTQNLQKKPPAKCCPGFLLPESTCEKSK